MAFGLRLHLHIPLGSPLLLAMCMAARSLLPSRALLPSPEHLSSCRAGGGAAPHGAEGLSKSGCGFLWDHSVQPYAQNRPLVNALLASNQRAFHFPHAQPWSPAQIDSSQLKSGFLSMSVGSPALPTPIPLLRAHRYGAAPSVCLAGERLKADSVP